MFKNVHEFIKTTQSVALAIMLLGAAQTATAHVNYIDLSEPLISPGGTNGSTFSNYGWWAGTTATLGESHELAGGDFFKFHLDADSLVSIAFSDDSNSGLLNPAFSLYRGLLADEAHDDTIVDPLNPRNSTPPFAKIASPVDDGVTADINGQVATFRDTANIDYNGQFDALHNWSMANESGEYRVLEYLTHVGPAGGNSVSLLNFYLLAGDYTIAAGGGTVYSADDAITGLSGTVSYSVSALPVPEPSQIGMLVAGLLLISTASMARRHS